MTAEGGERQDERHHHRHHAHDDERCLTPIGARPHSSLAMIGATEATVWPESRFITRTPVASRP